MKDRRTLERCFLDHCPRFSLGSRSRCHTAATMHPDDAHNFRTPGTIGSIYRLELRSRMVFDSHDSCTKNESGAGNGGAGSTWPRGLYVIVVSVILAGWYVIVRPFDSGRNTTRYRGNNTRKETRVAAVTRESRHERDHRRSFGGKAPADVVFEPNVSFWLCTSRGTSGSSLKRPSADGSQC